MGTSCPAAFEITINPSKGGESTFLQTFTNNEKTNKHSPTMKFFLLVEPHSVAPSFKREEDYENSLKGTKII